MPQKIKWGGDFGGSVAGGGKVIYEMVTVESIAVYPPGIKVFRLADPQGGIFWRQMAGTLAKMAGNSSKNN